jgi:ABC-type transport system substrate-binding protein
MECVNLPLFMNMCTAVQASWAQIGVKITVVPVISTLVTVEWRSGKYDAFMLSSQASADGSPIISTYFAPNTPLSGAFQPFGGDTAVTDLENKANVLPLGSKARNAAYQDIAAYLGKTPSQTIIAIWPPQYLYKSSVHGIENGSWSKLTSTWDERALWVAKAT